MWKLTFMGDFMDIISMSYFVELSHVNMNNYIFLRLRPLMVDQCQRRVIDYVHCSEN